MSHLSQNLEKLIQMISIEQLLGLVKQNNNKDVLSLPIVQKVVSAYEEEINILNTRMNTNFNSHSPSPSPTSNITNIPVKDYSDDIAKIHDQLGAINNSLLQLSEAIKSISFTASNSTAATSTAANNEEHIQLKIEEIKSVKLEVEVEVEDSDDEIELSDLEEDIIVEEEEEISVVEEEIKVIKIENSTVVTSLAENSTVVNLDADESEEESEKEISDSEEEEEEISETEVEVNLEEEEISETEVEISLEEAEEEIKEELNLEEEEVFEIEIDDVTYYATSEENGILYEVDADGEVGKQVGVIKDGEPIFS